jgi:predicted dehydrogenase
MARPESSSSPRPSRRQFLERSGAALVGAAFAPIGASSLAAAATTPRGLAGAANLALPNRMVHSFGTGTIKVGLLGCGGRGSGAAANAISADPNAELVAVGDLFLDQAQNCVANLKKSEHGAQVKVTPETTFVGLDAYKNVIAASDVVLLCTTPAFRPLHLKACVEAGKHTFVEKPIAVDGPGVRSVMESCRLAREKRLSVVSGLCYRYERKKRETIQRLHDGAVGEIVAAQCTYNTGALWHRGRGPDWTDMQWQLRNWLYFAWLSGDHIAEQHIHSLDKVAWALNDYPVSCVASGGRACRTDPKFGDVFDHFNTVYEWKSGVRLFSSCRQWQGAASDVSDWIYGTKGKANIQEHTIWGANAWSWNDQWKGKKQEEIPADEMYQNEHDAFFAALRKGEVIDNGDYMCKSTLMAIMGRVSAYSGQRVTAEQVLNSSVSIGPDTGSITFDTAPPTPVLAVPGVTKFS